MADLLTTLAEEHKNLSDTAATQAGKAIAGSMTEEHTNFVKTVTALLKSGKVNVHKPETILNAPVYSSLPFSIRGKVDLAAVNVADQLRRVSDFYLSKQTPDASPQLETMIEHLWQMKKRVEERYGNVFIF